MPIQVNDEARTCLKESFAEDMAGAQRLQGKLPTVRENENLALPIFERVERDIERARHVSATPPAPYQRPEKTQTQAKAEKLGYRLFYKEDGEGPSIFSAFTEHQVQEYKLRKRRVRLLLSKRESGPGGTPSWREITLAAVAVFVKTGREEPLRDVIEASCAIFGDWRKTPAPRLYSIGGVGGPTHR